MSDCSTKKIYTGGRVVGKVVGDVFKKNISGSRHILHKPRAIALSVESLTQAEKVGAQEIQITDKESGALYACPFERFKEYAFPIQRGGFEPQMALTLDRFDVTSPLDYSSRATKQGEIKHTPGNGKRTRNPRGVQLESPRQLLFKGML